ncbi:MAG: TonB-dependent receptor plug domain-containing protein, partial [Bacteroidota bacterium]
MPEIQALVITLVMMRYVLLCLLFLFIASTRGRAQTRPPQLSGKVVHARLQEAIEFATVKLFSLPDSTLRGGTVTDAGGLFSLPRTNGPCYLEASFLGFSTQQIADPRSPVRIELHDAGTTLDAVTVRSKRSQTEFKLDRRVFNVGEDLVGRGASALEVLDNVPSVSVDINGSIALRGAEGVQILVDGKPSALAAEGGNALGTLTAEMIDRIEVITNPSAKYDAAGTAGIINIVLRKAEKKGWNGSATLNTGTPNNHSLGLSLNRRSDHLNLFGQFGAGYRTFPLSQRRNNQFPASGT